ncbi:hypothetical protein CRYUN_Cryun20dG0054600 [Craigia yunnanensis]
MANTIFSRNILQAPAESPTRVPEVVPLVSDLPLPSNLPLIHRPCQKHFSPRSTPTLVAPAQPPLYGPLITANRPPTSSRLSKPLMKRSASVPPGADLPNIAPTQISPGAIPSGLAQSPLSPEVSNCCKPDSILKRGTHSCHCVYPIKLDLLLLHVSQNPNWNVFLAELASQLDLLPNQIEIINFYKLSLSRLNISMDISPHKGIGFSASDASKINSSLVIHRVHFDRNVVGDYKVLNFTWFEPPVPYLVSIWFTAPVVVSEPVEAPAHQSSNFTSLSPSNKGKQANLILIFGIPAGILVFAIISVLIICSCKFREEKTKASPIESVKPRTADAVARAGSLPHPSSTRFLQYEELKEATNNFAPASILGEGGFGRVFKDVLSDGISVAIKRLTSRGPQGDKEFLVEVEMLSRLHHRNLVKLVGYYSGRDSSQNLLCCELVPNGSLEAWLHGPLGVNCPLDWDTRMKIALDTARGLAYLHEDSQPCVIHGDLKASNILLILALPNKHLKAEQITCLLVYVAPEYAMTGHLLVKSDVYSYGVVLLELLTGRTPVDMSQPSGQENLATWARPILRDKDQLEELADPTSKAWRERVTEYQDSMLTISNNQLNQRQSTPTFKSDGTSSTFFSGPYSAFENDSISRTAGSSEDLHEGR